MKDKARTDRGCLEADLGPNNVRQLQKEDIAIKVHGHLAASVK